MLDNGIDDQGHSRTEELPALAEHFVAYLRRTIDRLHAAGIAEVHLVTDHGFLLLPGDAVDALGRPELPVLLARHRDTRWAALKPEAVTGQVMRLPLPLAPAWVLGFPRGVRTLVKAPDFLHGGISLQECVIPHLVSRVSLVPARVGLDLSVSTTRLAGGTVPAILRPVLDQAQAPLGGIQPMTVQLWVEAVLKDAEGPAKVTEPVEVLLRPDADELRPPIYLKEGLRLRAGQSLRLRAIDRDNDRDLGSIDLTLLVDWE